MDSGDRQLLHAALLEGEAALDAWNAWQQGRTLRALGLPRFHVLPSVYLNLKTQASEVAQGQELSGIHRFTWCKTQVTLRSAKAAVNALSDAGIPSLLIKGMPMVVFIRRQLGSRLMGDVDVLVREDRALAAIACLVKAGWQPTKAVPPVELLPFVHAVNLRNKDGHNLDLHWHPFNIETPVAATDALWQAARQGEHEGWRCSYPCAEDLVLLTCIHARKSDHASRLRWMVDLATLTKHDALDWPRLFDRALAAKLHFVLADCLLEYAELLPNTLPTETLDWARAQLAKPPPKGSLRFRDPWARQDRLSGLQDLPGIVERRFGLFRRICRQRKWTAGPHDFAAYALRYYQWEWELDRRRELPISVLKRIRRALRSNMQRTAEDSPDETI